MKWKGLKVNFILISITSINLDLGPFHTLGGYKGLCKLVHCSTKVLGSYTRQTLSIPMTLNVHILVDATSYIVEWAIVHEGRVGGVEALCAKDSCIGGYESWIVHQRWASSENFVWKVSHNCHNSEIKIQPRTLFNPNNQEHDLQYFWNR